MLELEKKRVWIAGRYWFKDTPITPAASATITNANNMCCLCHLSIQDTHYYEYRQQQNQQQQQQLLQWHPSCFQCSQCNISLNETEALLLDKTLYCQSCCNLDVNHPSIARCTRISLLQYNLNQLKAYLATATNKTASSSPIIMTHTANNLNGGNNKINSDSCILHVINLILSSTSSYQIIKSRTWAQDQTTKVHITCTRK